MRSLSDMIWVEWRKAIRSKMPIWTALGSLFMPLAIAFLIFVSKNPEISQKLGLISAKANLMAYASTDWKSYLVLFGELLAAGGFVLFILIISWLFGREFTDGTLKDLLAIPVPRASILLAKFIVMAIWSVGLSVVIFIGGLLMGVLIQLPGATLSIIVQACGVYAITSGLEILVVLPFAFFASAGRGYLLPVGLAVMALMMANLVAIAGWGELFPWAIPGIYSQGKTTLSAVSFLIVFLTGLAGMGATYLWWQVTDQNR